MGHAWDRARWETLYREAFPDIYRAVFAIVLNADTALDAVHDAFLVGLDHPPAEEANVRGWLFRVAARRALRLRWRPARRLEIDPQYRDELTHVLDRIETADLLKLLTRRQRSIVVAHYYMGMRQEEIAKALGVRRGTVGATISHALARMREEKGHV